MKLFKIMEGIDYKILQGNDVEIKALTIDSRTKSESILFFCIKGFFIDSHSFINDAVYNGTCAVIVEEDNVTFPENITVLKVCKSREALAIATNNFYSNPTNFFNLIGVTGTNGKTSSSYFLESILKDYNKIVGLIGTIETRVDSKKIDISFLTSTTPDTIELYKIFSKMHDEKATDVVMEVSSHALALEKVYGLNYKVAIFTNLTQDHLDMHGTMENYRDTKLKLFNIAENGVINIDDSYGEFFIKNSKCKVMTYSIDKPSDLQAVNIVTKENGTEFDIGISDEVHKFFIPMKGKFVIYNCLGVIGASLILNIPIDIIKLSISKMKDVPGRIQNVENNLGINVIVDYAHSPDGLKNIITAVKDITEGKVITIFGCGGDRDKLKRPIMGKVAGEFSDYCIITSDNPRSENPNKIIENIEVGINETNCEYEKEVDREKAIEKAIHMATKGDSVIIAGKGHETYQIFEKETINFDDVEVARQILIK